MKHCEREMSTILSSVYAELRSGCFSPEKVGFPLLKGLPQVFFLPGVGVGTPLPYFSPWYAPAQLCVQFLVVGCLLWWFMPAVVC